ncbi:putative E3 ubiquitin-protein ligase RF4 [Senna tora]|uniref:Putative E3 ubiquitin-protein ligase RF4 n=1 Tax=Senna tora TaxID=362788 RepID=A0A834SJF0_9FABA|nr:putative E3 ubiquitin-protein ligase RF4 [Senna tora]
MPLRSAAIFSDSDFNFSSANSFSSFTISSTYFCSSLAAFFIIMSSSTFARASSCSLSFLMDAAWARSFSFTALSSSILLCNILIYGLLTSASVSQAHERANPSRSHMTGPFYELSPLSPMLVDISSLFVQPTTLQHLTPPSTLSYPPQFCFLLFLPQNAKLSMVPGKRLGSLHNLLMCPVVQARNVLELSPAGKADVVLTSLLIVFEEPPFMSWISDGTCSEVLLVLFYHAAYEGVLIYLQKQLIEMQPVHTLLMCLRISLKCTATKLSLLQALLLKQENFDCLMNLGNFQTWVLQTYYFGDWKMSPSGYLACEMFKSNISNNHIASPTVKEGLTSQSTLIISTMDPLPLCIGPSLKGPSQPRSGQSASSFICTSGSSLDLSDPTSEEVNSALVLCEISADNSNPRNSIRDEEMLSGLGSIEE